MGRTYLPPSRTRPCRTPATASASACDRKARPEVILVKYRSCARRGPIPFALRDFAVIEDIRDLLDWKLPAYAPDFVLMCRDDRLSDTQSYGIRVHKSVVRCNGSLSMRADLDTCPTATGYQFGLKHVSVIQAIVTFLYTGNLSYNVNDLPFSEAFFLVDLYRTAVNKGLWSLADGVCSRVSLPETQIGGAEDIKSILQIVLYGMIGSKTGGDKRRSEIREAVLERFVKEVWENGDEGDLLQFCQDDADFTRDFLQAVAGLVKRTMADTGFQLDELD